MSQPLPNGFLQSPDKREKLKYLKIRLYTEILSIEDEKQRTVDDRRLLNVLKTDNDIKDQIK